MCLSLVIPATSRDFRPEAYLETIPASDSSVQECYVFRTTAGVRYTVETSSDLNHWTAQDEIYGLGNEYVVTMRQFTPPPPPPPGAPVITFPPPAVNASLRMERASGAAGGTVVSWSSLDHEGPVVVRIAGEMVPEWLQVPLYAERFSGHCFFVWHPRAVANPPIENSILGAKDSAMLAVLEANLPTMNSQVTTSVALARNAPAPVAAPPDPNSKRFWRILVNSGIDTDSDGTPDWSEFQMAADVASGFPIRTIGFFPNGAAPIGNPFNSDTNGDGIPDGEQLDTDKDGKADAFDIASSDATATYDITPIPRYALFEIPGNALQISDLGTVLYSDKTWKGGSITGLPGGPADAGAASGRGINDLDVIIGTQGRNTNNPANPQYLNGKICYWPSPTLPFQFVQVTDSGEDVFAYRQHDGFGEQGPGPVLSSSGHFKAHGYVEDPEPDYEDEFGWAPTLWQVPTGGAGANRQAIPPFPFPELPFAPFNLIPQLLPAGGTATFATPPVDFTNSTAGETTKVYLDGRWQETPTYAMALDISADGTAIGLAHGGIQAPILLNGKWTDIKRYAPDAPSEWADINTDLLDTTPGGWVLANRNNGTNAGANGVLLPLRVEGQYTRTEMNPDGSFFTDKKAVGVDSFSIGALNPGPAVRDRIWIMAPIGGRTNQVTIKAPLNPGTPLKITAVGITFPEENEGTMEGPEAPLEVVARSTTPSGADVTAILKMGPENEAVVSKSQPIGIKPMKNRVVKVNVFQICRRQAPAGPYAFATLMPVEPNLTAHLNDMFRPQINVTFDVMIHNLVIPLVWDANGNQTLDTSSAGTYTIEQETILAALPEDRHPADLTVLIVASRKDDNTVVPLDGDSAGITNRTGTANFPGATCWILGERSGKQDSRYAQLDTICHEIGHVFVGYGHPDQRQNPGPAPLHGTERQVGLRLMCSGGKSSVHSRLLVKGEWDQADAWLTNRPLGDN